MLQKRFADLYSVDWELQRYGFSWLPVLSRPLSLLLYFGLQSHTDKFWQVTGFPLRGSCGVGLKVLFSFITLSGDPFFTDSPQYFHG